MSQEPNNYLAYLLRLWRESKSDPWRASLQAPGQAEAHAFPSLAALLKFLEAQMGRQAFQAEPGETRRCDGAKEEMSE